MIKYCADIYIHWEMAVNAMILCLPIFHVIQPSIQKQDERSCTQSLDWTARLDYRTQFFFLFFSF